VPLQNIFTKEVTENILERIHQLTPTSKAKWGKMDVAQMLAHCNVTYEMAFENIHPKPNFFMKFILKKLVKPKVVNEETYPHNGQTAPQFIIKDSKKFEEEKMRLINYITKAQLLGEVHFEGKESHSFGSLTAVEWNNMFYKHLNHHLTQFGV
jgi:hypothetical protein